MREIRIYHPGEYTIGDIINLQESSSHHIASVLRMQVGQKFTVFAGDGIEYEAEIECLKKNRVSACILIMKSIKIESEHAIHLAQALCKGDKMEWIIQKSVELGVAAITPILTDHVAYSVNQMRLQKKQQQWQAIAIAACEQCGRNTIPMIHAPVCFRVFLHRIEHAAMEVVLLDPRAEKNLTAYLQMPSTKKCTIACIGPEGGFSAEEITQAYTQQIICVKMGARILRTETAAIAAITLLQAYRGDL